MRGKEEKKGRGKEEKKRRKGGGKNGDQIAKKKRKKKRSLCASFSSVQSSFFGSIRNMLFREEHTISTFIYMQDFFDEQIMWLLRAKNPPPPPFFAILPKSSGSPKDTQKSEKSADSGTNWLYFNRISYQTMFKCIKTMIWSIFRKFVYPFHCHSVFMHNWRQTLFERPSLW